MTFFIIKCNICEDFDLVHTICNNTIINSPGDLANTSAMTKPLDVVQEFNDSVVEGATALAHSRQSSRSVFCYNKAVHNQ